MYWKWKFVHFVMWVEKIMQKKYLHRYIWMNTKLDIFFPMLSFFYYLHFKKNTTKFYWKPVRRLHKFLFALGWYLTKLIGMQGKSDQMLDQDSVFSCQSKILNFPHCVLVTFLLPLKFKNCLQNLNPTLWAWQWNFWFVFLKNESKSILIFFLFVPECLHHIAYHF